jgi:hypothetical protein
VGYSPGGGPIFCGIGINELVMEWPLCQDVCFGSAFPLALS